MTMTAADGTQLAEVVRAQMERWAVPGLALGVLSGAEVEAWGYGTTSLETRQPVTAETLFQVGSISKVFTATLVMQLVEQGKVGLDAPVLEYLPSLRLADDRATRSVTLRHLLTHTAGFYGDRFDDFGHGDDALTRSLGEFHTLRQYTAPGELWAYCNTGFQLAGAVIEAVLDSTFEAAMHERIFRPLGLDRTFYFAHEAITYPAAVGHNTRPVADPDIEPVPEPEVARAWGRSRCRAAQGGIISTVGDLLRFAAFHMGDGTANGERVLSTASLRSMQEPLVGAGLSPHWGIGWAVEEIAGERIVSHGGTTNGFQARLVLVPERRVALACLTNSSLGAAAIRGTEASVLSSYAGLGRPEPVTEHVSPEALARFAGRYERPGNIITVSLLDGGLRLEVAGENPQTKADVTLPPRRAVPVGDGRFLIVDGEQAGSTFQFIPGEGGRPRFLRLGGRLADRVD